MRIKELLEDLRPILIDLVEDALVDDTLPIYFNWKGDGGQLIRVDDEPARSEVTFVYRRPSHGGSSTFTYQELDLLELYPGQRLYKDGTPRDVLFLRARRK